ncbi:MAG: hypothetical protein V7682_05720 [Cycloclasticus sp.]
MIAARLIHIISSTINIKPDQVVGALIIINEIIATNKKTITQILGVINTTIQSAIIGLSITATAINTSK